MDTFDRLSLVCIARWATARVLPQNGLASLHQPRQPLSATPAAQPGVTTQEVAP